MSFVGLDIKPPSDRIMHLCSINLILRDGRSYQRIYNKPYVARQKCVNTAIKLRNAELRAEFEEYFKQTHPNLKYNHNIWNKIPRIVYEEATESSIIAWITQHISLGPEISRKKLNLVINLMDQLTGELAYVDLVDSGTFVGAEPEVILLAKQVLKLNRSFWNDWIEEHLASSANKNAHYWKSK
jgi:hypothetical protein